MDSTTSTINTQKHNSANASVSGNISKKTLEEKIEGVIKKIAKNIKLDGFRKGKVPKNLIQSRYKEQIEQDSKQEAIQDLLTEGAKKLGISHTQILGNPAITKFEEKDGQIDVEIKISLTPEFSVDKALSCVPEVKLPAVSKKQIDERLEEIAKSRAPLKEMPKTHALVKDDVATIDFEGFIDGKAFEGGKGENYNLSIGSNQFIPGFEDSLIGMKTGENKTIKVTFPKDYNAAHLAGKEAEFKVSVHKISQKELPKIDDAFAKSVLGDSGTLEGLKDAIKEQLEVENKTNAYNKELKEKLLNALIKEISFDLPELIVEQEMDILFRNALNAIAPEEFEEIKNDEKKAKAKRDSFKEEAQKSVQVTFIMDALAKKNNIAISDNEVLQTIYYESMMMGQDPKAMMEYYKANNLLPAIKMAMVEDRVLNFLLDSKLEDSKKAKDSKTSQEDKKEAQKEGQKPKSAPKTTKDS
ncbi:trigger factor [Helicobacter sp. MIT 00-7814]|uniref:trigger factor n=1 Tax=unclassified Helicobacter TaxID=2593540 RepID=UPI000E1E4238|nr:MULTISPECIES: trigger factor [unclassified Helicobacter]RDU55250.1 trigger factor [Helicobacter sp. MIT 99-10781]RDU56088.1 trigger factor [Helicobacter sp. MIT 00-7814]